MIRRLFIAVQFLTRLPVSRSLNSSESDIGRPQRSFRLAALDQLLQIHKQANVALITHGGIGRTIIASVLGMPPKNLLRLAQDYGCLNVVDWYEANPMLRLLNCRYKKVGGIRPDFNL